MARNVRERTPRQPPSVEHIELNEDKLHKRFILVVLLLALGLGAIAGGVAGLLRVDKGWRQLDADRGALSCAGEFVLYYDLGRGELSPSRELKLCRSVFTAACQDAYVLFDAHQRLENVRNLAYISDHVNEICEVEPALYRALEKAAGSRLLYLAPVYEVYSGLFYAQDPLDAEQADPFAQPEAAAWCAEAAAYARDPESVELELLGENRVRLRASEEYLRFLSESGVTDLLDFFWLENAVQADYLAERLAQEGFPNGCLVSSRGCVRCFAPGECPFSESLYHLEAGEIRLAARLGLSSGLAAVSLRAYPLTDADAVWYRRMGDGSLRTPFVDGQDGLCRAALPELLGLSEELGCQELALALSEAMIGESFSEEELSALKALGGDAVWVEGKTLRATDHSLPLEAENGFTLE